LKTRAFLSSAIGDKWPVLCEKQVPLITIRDAKTSQKSETIYCLMGKRKSMLFYRMLIMIISTDFKSF